MTPFIGNNANTKNECWRHMSHSTTSKFIPVRNEQICNRSVLIKTDQLQTTLSSADSCFSLLQTLSLNTRRDVKTADEKQTNNRSADDLQHAKAQKLILLVKLWLLICYSIRKWSHLLFDQRRLVEIELGVRNVSKEFIFSKMKIRNLTLVIALLHYICCACSPSSRVKSEKTIFRRSILR